MTDIDISKIKPGDYVTVRGKVHVINGGMCMVHIKDVNCLYALTVDNSEIATHEPASEQLKIGDVVAWDSLMMGNPYLTIIGLYGDKAWLLESNTDRYTDAPLSRLRRVEQP
jgi:hypothetical protein